MGGPATGTAGEKLVAKSDERRQLSELRAGRPEAWTQLIRSCYAAIYRLLVHLTQDVHQAEDLTQETFAVAWTKLAAFEGRSTLTTWLHRIAYTKFIDARRAGRGAARALEHLPVGGSSLPGPLEAVIADDEARRLYIVLGRLEEPDRTVLILHYLQGLSYREMATVLGEPDGTVKWRTAEALKRLRARWNHEAPDHGPRKTPLSGCVG
jgi:RNA polymerase sigma-70 factor (ECF subfamily)